MVTDKPPLPDISRCRWLYQRGEGRVGPVWHVGYYDPEFKWHADSTHLTQGGALERVHYLNGGEK